MVTAAGLIHAARQKNRCNDVPQCWPHLALCFESPMTVPHALYETGLTLNGYVAGAVQQNQATGYSCGSGL